jgi:hypothetical protein
VEAVKKEVLLSRVHRGCEEVQQPALVAKLVALPRSRRWRDRAVVASLHLPVTSRHPRPTHRNLLGDLDSTAISTIRWLEPCCCGSPDQGLAMQGPLTIVLINDKGLDVFGLTCMRMHGPVVLVGTGQRAFFKYLGLGKVAHVLLPLNLDMDHRKLDSGDSVFYLYHRSSDKAPVSLKSNC